MKKDGKAVSLLKKGSSIAGASVANVVSALIGGTVAGLPGSAAGAAAAKACEIVIEGLPVSTWEEMAPPPSGADTSFRPIQ